LERRALQRKRCYEALVSCGFSLSEPFSTQGEEGLRAYSTPVC
jgi:hypothetical protein